MLLLRLRPQLLGRSTQTDKDTAVDSDKLACRSTGDVPDFNLPEPTPNHGERFCHVWQSKVAVGFWIKYAFARKPQWQV